MENKKLNDKELKIASLGFLPKFYLVSGNPAIDPGDAMVTVLSYAFFLSVPVSCAF